MSRSHEKLMKFLKQRVEVYQKIFEVRYRQQFIDFLELPIRVILSPFTLAYDIAGSSSRGFGIPKFISDVSFSAIFVVATIGTYDIALELGKKVLCQREQDGDGGSFDSYHRLL